MIRLVLNPGNDKKVESKIAMSGIDLIAIGIMNHVDIRVVYAL